MTAQQAPPKPAPAEATPVSPKLRALYDRVVKQYDRMQAMADADDAALDKLVPAISGWSVGQHLDHSANTDKVIIMAIEVSLFKNDPNVPPPKFMGKVVLFTGYIPRGKGKAPDMTMPKAKTNAEMRENLKKVRNSLEAIGKKLDKVQAGVNRAPHPMLGGFVASQWLRFIEIHQNHHLRIIADIQKAG